MIGMTFLKSLVILLTRLTISLCLASFKTKNLRWSMSVSMQKKQSAFIKIEIDIDGLLEEMVVRKDKKYSEVESQKRIGMTLPVVRSITSIPQDDRNSTIRKGRSGYSGDCYSPYLTSDSDVWADKSYSFEGFNFDLATWKPEKSYDLSSCGIADLLNTALSGQGKGDANPSRTYPSIFSLRKEMLVEWSTLLKMAMLNDSFGLPTNEAASSEVDSSVQDQPTYPYLKEQPMKSIVSRLSDPCDCAILGGFPMAGGQSMATAASKSLFLALFSFHLAKNHRQGQSVILCKRKARAVVIEENTAGTPRTSRPESGADATALQPSMKNGDHDGKDDHSPVRILAIRYDSVSSTFHCRFLLDTTTETEGSFSALSHSSHRAMDPNAGRLSADTYRGVNKSELMGSSSPNRIDDKDGEEVGIEGGSLVWVLDGVPDIASLKATPGLVQLLSRKYAQARGVDGVKSNREVRLLPSTHVKAIRDTEGRRLLLLPAWTGLKLSSLLQPSPLSPMSPSSPVAKSSPSVLDKWILLDEYKHTPDTEDNFIPSSVEFHSDSRSGHSTATAVPVAAMSLTLARQLYVAQSLGSSCSARTFLCVPKYRIKIAASNVLSDPEILKKYPLHFFEDALALSRKAGQTYYGWAFEAYVHHMISTTFSGRKIGLTRCESSNIALQEESPSCFLQLLPYDEMSRLQDGGTNGNATSSTPVSLHLKSSPTLDAEEATGLSSTNFSRVIFAGTNLTSCLNSLSDLFSRVIQETKSDNFNREREEEAGLPGPVYWCPGYPAFPAVDAVLLIPSEVAIASPNVPANSCITNQSEDNTKNSAAAVQPRAPQQPNSKRKFGRKQPLRMSVLYLQMTVAPKHDVDMSALNHVHDAVVRGLRTKLTISEVVPCSLSEPSLSPELFEFDFHYVAITPNDSSARLLKLRIQENGSLVSKTRYPTNYRPKINFYVGYLRSV